ncbi:MAG TPA: hypothetical protein VL354_10100 [Spirochaetia bacterium]|nr:hypothetical protein [Spirochaetia bacterium]
MNLTGGFTEAELHENIRATRVKLETTDDPRKRHEYSMAISGYSRLLDCFSRKATAQQD